MAKKYNVAELKANVKAAKAAATAAKKAVADAQKACIEGGDAKTYRTAVSEHIAAITALEKAEAKLANTPV